MAYDNKYVKPTKVVDAIVSLMDLGVPSRVAVDNVLNALRVAGIGVSFD